MKTLHTPWKTITHPDGRMSLVDAKGGEPCTKDNAAFIVRACNSHYEILAALETIVNSEEMETGTFVCDFQSLQSVARAALAKAKG